MLLMRSRYLRLIWLQFMLGGAWLSSQPADAAPNAYETARAIDRLLEREVFLSQTQPTHPSSDEAFLRRASLDVLGDIPAPEEVVAFVIDPSPQKRRALIAQLLDRPQFGQNWARYWRDVILSRRLQDRARLVTNSLVVHLTDKFNKNVAWDTIAAEFITARGNVRENGATGIIVAQDGRTEEVTAEMSRIFLGIQIQCAQCHDHPYDRWKREQFHELAAFFPRVALRPLRSATMRSLTVVGNDNPRQRRNRGNANRRGRPEHYMPDLDNPDSRGTITQPKFFLTGASLPVGTDDHRRREQLAAWMTGNRWFATAFVNRMWAELVGEGFYEPIDDLGPDRSPTAPETLSLLTTHFIEQGHNVKWLFRTICATKAYGRQSRPRRKPEEPPFAANVAQRLRADQLFNALLTALEIDEPRLTRDAPQRRYDRQSGPRQLFDAVFGYDPSVQREEIAGSVPQALLMMNSPRVNRLLRAAGPRTMLGRLLNSEEHDEDVVYELYLRCLGREPDSAEVTTALAYCDSIDSRRAAFEDLLWGLLNSAEFMYRH